MPSLVELPGHISNVSRVKWESLSGLFACYDVEKTAVWGEYIVLVNRVACPLLQYSLTDGAISKYESG